MKYISLSLFGVDEKYRTGLFACVESAKAHYADWFVLVYCDRDNYNQLAGIDLPSTRLILHQENSRGLEGASWRLFAATLPDAEVVIFRDIDSILTARDRQVVDEWLASPFDVHIIRDHPYHRAPIMAGMFGVRRAGLACLKRLIAGGIDRDSLAHYGADQAFLGKHFYPEMRALAMVHTSFVRYLMEYVVPVPDLADGEDFIGAYHNIQANQRSEFMRIRQTVLSRTLIPSSWEGNVFLRQIGRVLPTGIRYRSRWAI